MTALANEARRNGVRDAVDSISTHGDEIKAENDKKLEKIQQEMKKLEKEYVDVIKNDFFMKKQKLNELAKEILPQVGMDDPNELTAFLIQELVEDVSEEDSKVIFDNLEDYKDILVDFINSQLDQVKSYGKGGVFETEPEFYEITVAGKTYKVLIAQSEEDKEQGLQGVEFLEDNEGMLFDYSEEMPEELSF
jgi:hypothetical protein